jgi:hypothetical protein
MVLPWIGEETGRQNSTAPSVAFRFLFVYDGVTPLRALIIANHGFTLEAIDRSEEEELTSIQKSFELEDHATITSAWEKNKKKRKKSGSGSSFR